MDSARQVREIARRMRAETPVFIVGTARSGTSMVYRAIQKHSHFRLGSLDAVASGQGVLGLFRSSMRALRRASGPTEELTESIIFIDPEGAASGGKTRDNLAFRYMMSDERAFDSFCELARFIQTRSRRSQIFGDFDREELWSLDERQLKWKRQLHDLLVLTYFHFAQSVRRVARIVEKTPNHVHFVPEIRATFPKAKILCVLRHPVDIFSSYRRRLQVERGEPAHEGADLSWLQISVEDFCAAYRQATGIALSCQQEEPDSFMLVRYEDATAQPARTFEKIFSFIGEPFDEECIIEKKQTVWEHHVDPLLFQGVTKNERKWADHISDEDARAIQAELGDAMGDLDYAEYR